MLALIAALAVAFQPEAAVCGVERRDIKTMTDPEAGRIDFSFVTSVTVEQMHGLEVPQRDADLRGSVELMVFRIKARLIGYKLEDDGDIHAVIQGTSGATMVVELPDKKCVRGAPAEKEIDAAREAFQKAFPHLTRKFVVVADAPLVEVEGVGFFDFVHGQRGVAPNGIELHPVTKFKKL